MFKCIVCFSIFIGFAFSTPEDFAQLKSGLPNPVSYYNIPDLKAEESKNGDKASSNNEHEPRFGIQLGYGNDIQGYSGGNLMGTYTPLKIDLGGLLIGTVIGLGAVLLAPKLLHLFSPHSSPHHSGPYARSEDSMLGSIGNVLSRINETLQEHEIDTMACLQKAACSLVRSATSTPGRDVVSNSSNPILNFLIDGSKLKYALDRGLNGENCAAAFPQCNISSSSLLKDNKL